MRIYHYPILLHAALWLTDSILHQSNGYLFERFDTEAGFDCIGELSSVLEQHLSMRGVLPRQAMILILGSCVGSVEFGASLGHDLGGTSSGKEFDISTVGFSVESPNKRTPQNDIRTGLLEKMREHISEMIRVPRPLIIYFCKDVNIDTHPEFFMPYSMDNDIYSQIRPLILFMIGSHKTTKIHTYAFVWRCTTAFDHVLIDKFHVRSYPATKLTPIADTRLAATIDEIGNYHDSSMLQIRTMDAYLQPSIKNISLRQRFQKQLRFIRFQFEASEKGETNKLELTYRDFVFSFYVSCLKLLAVVEPSENAFIQSFTFMYGLLLMSTILLVVILSTGASFTNGLVLCFQICGFGLSSYEVRVPNARRTALTCRMVVLGLFLVLYSWVIVGDYKNELTSGLLEPERDILNFSHLDQRCESLDLSVVLRGYMPYHIARNVTRMQVYNDLLCGKLMCYPNPELIRAHLGVPLKTTQNYEVTFGLVVIKSASEVMTSPIVSRIREHNLLPMTSKYLFAGDAGLDVRTRMFIRVASQSRYWKPGGKSYWHYENWKPHRLLLAELHAENNVLIDTSELTVVFRLNHLQCTLLICIVALVVAAIVIVWEILFNRTSVLFRQPGRYTKISSTIQQNEFAPKRYSCRS